MMIATITRTTTRKPTITAGTRKDCWGSGRAGVVVAIVVVTVGAIVVVIVGVIVVVTVGAIVVVTADVDVAGN